MENPRLLITGAGGFLGWHLCRLAQRDWEVWAAYHRHPPRVEEVIPIQADLKRMAEIREMLDAARPDAIIHAAAISDPNICQSSPAASARINVTATEILAAFCAEKARPFLFTSSDMVFDGASPPYSESDAPNPLSLYGAQKHRAEIATQVRHPDATVCRLPLMIGWSGGGRSVFDMEMLRQLGAGRPVRLFTDQYRTPVSGADAARGILMVLGRAAGLIHLGGPERISRYGLGELAVRALDASPGLLRPARQADIPMAAPRPADVSLNSDRAVAMGYQPSPPATVYRESMQHLREALPAAERP